MIPVSNITMWLVRWFGFNGIFSIIRPYCAAKNQSVVKRLICGNFFLILLEIQQRDKKQQVGIREDETTELHATRLNQIQLKPLRFGRLLRHSARKRGVGLLGSFRAYTGHSCPKKTARTVPQGSTICHPARSVDIRQFTPSDLID